jgi:hypothetical protein
MAPQMQACDSRVVRVSIIVRRPPVPAALRDSMAMNAAGARRPTLRP